MDQIKKLKINGREYSIDGESAYEVAVRNGFEGTEEEWLASLKGEPGADGDTGKSAYEYAKDGGYTGTEEDFAKSLADIDNTNDLPKVEYISGEEVNKIITADEVFTTEELRAYPSDAILKGYQIKGNNLFEATSDYNTLKVFCSEGDVLRSKLAPYWYHSSVLNSKLVCAFYNSAGQPLGSYVVTFTDRDDLITNGVVVPANTAYALYPVYKYYFTEPTEDNTKRGENGLTCDVVTINQDPSYTYYAEDGVLPDYIPAGGGEPHYKFSDDVRIERYEEKISELNEAIGDVETILEEVVGGVE